MFGFGKKNENKSGLLKKLKSGLARTRQSLSQGLNRLLAKKKIDAELLDELEILLLTADVGVETTRYIIDQLHQQVKAQSIHSSDDLMRILKSLLLNRLNDCPQPKPFTQSEKTRLILMVGVNGVGKTTTIGKLAKQLQREGKKVMLAAGDTFRAAAVEQLQSWGEKNQIPVVAQHTGADSASVIYDALQSATAKQYDVLIADTAGRLHTQSNLMDELAKIARVVKKIDANAPHEVLLVVDATTGQNAVNQAKQFNQTIPLTGIVMTKLDGTAKGGVVFAVVDQIKVPIRFIGIGEGIDDLKPFDAVSFVDALFQNDPV